LFRIPFKQLSHLRKYNIAFIEIDIEIEIEMGKKINETLEALEGGASKIEHI